MATENMAMPQLNVFVIFYPIHTNSTTPRRLDILGGGDVNWALLIFLPHDAYPTHAHTAVYAMTCLSKNGIVWK